MLTLRKYITLYLLLLERNLALYRRGLGTTRLLIEYYVNKITTLLDEVSGTAKEGSRDLRFPRLVYDRTTFGLRLRIGS